MMIDTGKNSAPNFYHFPAKREEMKTGGRWYYASGRIFTEKIPGSFQCPASHR
jgi:hypothetical protein